MFTILKPRRKWSDIGLSVLIGSVLACVVLVIADGILHGPIAYSQTDTADRSVLVMLTYWVIDFRYLAEQGVYAATIFFVGAKFFETRTIFTIGFDAQDADKLSLKGPDADNIVWIGHRYANAMEAEMVAIAFAERLKQSAA
ncbi:MAG: hypothetical protein JSR60_04940 [Proteobacteria bacterium]|nr:hypothetical protein [Pseudomonadota bacterium]